VLAICVNWNGGEVLTETIGSLLATNHPLLDVVVVDNNSSDNSLETLPPTVQIMRLEKNLGYAGAINSVIAPILSGDAITQHKSYPDYIVVLNSDLKIPPMTIPRMIEFSEEAQAHIVGPKVLLNAEQKTLEAAWGEINWSHVLVKLVGKDANPKDPRWNRPKQVELLLGSFLLIKFEVFQKVGLFDERFFMYHEEVDFLYRARQKGLRIYFFPKVEIVHRGAYSSRKTPLRKVYWVRRSTILFMKKHAASCKDWGIYFVTLVASILFNLTMIRIGRVQTIFKAVFNGFRSCPKV
jgi:GT2 family glycosyltransferase